MSLTAVANRSEYYEQMNQSWQKIVAPNVFGRWGTNDQVTTDKKANYKLGDLIKKIDALHAQGKLVCIFIGRTPYEKLPTDYHEVNENEVWLSADACLISPEGCEELKDMPGVEDRMHLWFDLNQQDGLELIKGLFDKVAVDNSTTKALGNDFASRFAILLRNQESALIFPNPGNRAMPLAQPIAEFNFDTTHYTLYVPFEVHDAQDKKMVSECFSKYISSATQDEVKSDKKACSEEWYFEEEDEMFNASFQAFIARRYEQTADDWEIKMCSQHIKTHLESRYHSVEHHSKERYPYSFHEGVDNYPYDYFVVRNSRAASKS